MYLHLGIYKKPRPFNHIFGGDRILRAWYRGIKNAGPRKRAQGRAQDIPYHHISPYHHGIWRIFIECGKKNHARKSAQGRSARGPILPKSNRNFWQPPFTYMGIYLHTWHSVTVAGKVQDDGCWTRRDNETAIAGPSWIMQKLESKDWKDNLKMDKWRSQPFFLSIFIWVLLHNEQVGLQLIVKAGSYRTLNWG